MTPVYSAPEVFDAHPSLHSDQYSLAIVYQEMFDRAASVHRQNARPVDQSALERQHAV